MQIINHQIPKSMQSIIEFVKNHSNNSEVHKLFENAFLNTYQTSLEISKDETFVVTGDIPAMWLRDSTCQIRPLLLAKEDQGIRNIIKGVINMQQKQILIDPYANAFNKDDTTEIVAEDDITDMHSLVWERKYELDSLCYHIQLLYLYYVNTNDDSIISSRTDVILKKIIDVIKIEQNHFEKSNYSFRRIADWLLFKHPERIPLETLNNKGKGNIVEYTGMSWSGFRPSDDACKYGYLVPSNCFAIVVLQYISEISKDEQIINEAKELSEAIQEGVNKYAIIDKKYMYEVDGRGNYLFMDDANVPSLLSLPYLGYCNVDDQLYQNTRKAILSKENPYFYEYKNMKGIGSPHTPDEYIWHISLIMEGLTTNDVEEKERILEVLLNSHANTFLMHESFSVYNPEVYTRPWFGWANALFSEFILSLYGKEIKK